jgi:hypothetical protein
MPTALVTGASSGIGHAFARKLAADGYQLILVARNAERLEEVAEELRAQHRVEVEVLPADLTRRDELQLVAERLGQVDRPVDLLVNNAGFALQGMFLSGDVGDEEKFMDIMIRAVLVLSRAALPGMVARERGGVITVSSVAGFIPSGTYSAAKAWATTFTMSLNGELAGSGVTATALCPGYVRTDFHPRAGLDMSYLPRWAWIKDDRLVKRCLADVGRRKALSVPTLRYTLAVFILRHAPLWIVLGAGRRRAVKRAKAYRRELEQTATAPNSADAMADARNSQGRAQIRRGRRAAAPVPDGPIVDELGSETPPGSSAPAPVPSASSPEVDLRTSIPTTDPATSAARDSAGTSLGAGPGTGELRRPRRH